MAGIQTAKGQEQKELTPPKMPFLLLSDHAVQNISSESKRAGSGSFTPGFDKQDNSDTAPQAQFIVTGDS